VHESILLLLVHRPYSKIKLYRTLIPSRVTAQYLVQKATQNFARVFLRLEVRLMLDKSQH